jgi:mannose-6-phosphate isomerase-like protein (cupin superfamily)
MTASDNLQSALNNWLSNKPEWAAYMPAMSLQRSGRDGANPLATGAAAQIMSHLPEIAGLANDDTSALVEIALAAKDQLTWFSTYKGDDVRVGRGKVARTAVSTLTGSGGMFASTAAMSGLFYLRGDVEYASHSHEADEIYVILAGKGQFYHEDIGWHDGNPGDVIEHKSWVKHAMTTARAPMLIFWAHIGGGIGNSPKLHSADGSLPLGLEV